MQNVTTGQRVQINTGSFAGYLATVIACDELGVDVRVRLEYSGGYRNIPTDWLVPADNSREALPADGVHAAPALRTLDDLSAAVARLAARNARQA